MDKQEAIDYVLDELDKGRSPAEITAALSRKLGAPVELVSKFVRQTTVRYQQSKAGLGQSLTAGQKPVAANQEPLTYSPKPSAYSLQPTAFSQPKGANSLQPTAYDLQIAANRPAAVGMEAREAIPEPNAAYAPPLLAMETRPAAETRPVAEIQPAAETPALVEREGMGSAELEKFILDKLGTNTRDSDVVLGVIERTGMEYRQAQRLVSRVGARNLKKVTTRQNCLIVSLALVFLAVGLVLLGASVIVAYQIRFLLPSPNNLSYEQIQAAYEKGRNLVPWAFITGLVLSVGGGMGLFSAIRKQME